MADYTILAQPRISRHTFARILANHQSPAAPVAGAAYDAITRHGVDPALELAMFQHESSFGRAGAAVSRHNWGNLRRSPGFPTVGGFVKYPDWMAGAGDTARLLAVYGRNEIRPRRRTNTARTFPYVWAPSSDGNRPLTYGEAIVNGIERFISLDGGHVHDPVQPNGKHPHDDQQPGGAKQRYVARADHSRLRTGPNVDATIVRTVNAGATAVIDQEVQGGPYDVLGQHATTWVRIVRLGGIALPTPVYSAAVLWKRA